MKGNFSTIVGKATGINQLHAHGRIIRCWENSMQAAVAPQPLDLSPHEGKVVAVRGRLHEDLWDARLEAVVNEGGFQSVTGKVVGSNTVETPGGPVSCYRNGMAESWYMPLNLAEYMGETITVEGELHGGSLYRAQIGNVPVSEPGRSAAKEAKSLNDLLRIRAANREKIEAVNGNLGTALGFKWSNGLKTDHPCIIIFVPQKTVSWLVPEDERVPKLLEAPDGTWCLTDVVTGGKAASLEDVSPLPELDDENKAVVQALRSGRTGLVGGIQIAFYGEGIEDSQHSYVGTAGIAVRHKETGGIGFLTNQHVADAPGRRIYHPWHGRYQIGATYKTKVLATDENWYGGFIDEEYSYVRCDCGFVKVDEPLAQHVQQGVYVMGRTGPLLRIKQDRMDIIGQKVISVGRTRGVQRGTIVAYAYEFQDEYYSIYTDFLIIGEDGMAFSWKGDSGKVIVTDDEEHRPIALLWGGWQERLRGGREQEKWSYAIDLGKVLDCMDLELLE